MRTNVSSVGIEVVATFARATGGKIIPLKIESRRLFDFRQSYHRGSGRIPRVRHMIDWLDPVIFPWFKDEFVHPCEFKAVYIRVNPWPISSGLLNARTIEPE
jgi:hypothetical protein